MIEAILFGIACYGCAWYFRFAIAPGQMLGIWGRVLESIPENVAKPLGKCRVCFSFWLAASVSVFVFADPLLVFCAIGGAGFGAMIDWQ